MPSIAVRLLDRMLGNRLPERPQPGVVWGERPMRAERERRGPALGWVRAWSQGIGAPGRAWVGAASRRHARWLADELERLVASGQGADAGATHFGRQGTRPRLTRAASSRIEHIDAILLRVGLAIHQQTGLRVNRAQFDAALAMLADAVAELPTGEGKTLALVLAVCTRALTGVPVHVVTSNDALVARDAAQLRPIAGRLGLDVACVLAETDQAGRAVAYRTDICYATARELMFDELRDRLMSTQTLNGHCSVFIDEVDSILIDEAVVPCILAMPVNSPHDPGHVAALDVARAMVAGRDFVRDASTPHPRLTEAGRRQCAVPSLAGGQGLLRIARHREELVERALAALHAYRRDRDYLVADGKVVIVDPISARMADGRVWSDGLHQMIEIKEGLASTEVRSSTVRITAQQFFGRYWRLAGLSATVSEAAAELRDTYGIGCRVIRPVRASARIDLPPKLFDGQREHREAIVSRVRQLVAEGRATLVATASVADCDAVRDALVSAGVPARAVHAGDEAQEEQVVAGAGQPGSVIVTTPMLGRGTDIRITESVRGAGGLAVVATCLYRDRRIDRQLHGRCARQGAPGSVETLLDIDRPIADEDRGFGHGPAAWLPRPWVLRRIGLWRRHIELRAAQARMRLLDELRQAEQAHPLHASAPVADPDRRSGVAAHRSVADASAKNDVRH